MNPYTAEGPTMTCTHNVPASKCYPAQPYPAHDCEYVTAREALIPLAELHANATIGNPPEEANESALQRTNALEAWGNKWDKAFLGEMDRLARVYHLIR